MTAATLGAASNATRLARTYWATGLALLDFWVQRTITRVLRPARRP
jgi:hypothetical protein